MATVFQPPFWVPRPDDLPTQWQGTPKSNTTIAGWRPSFSGGQVVQPPFWVPRPDDLPTQWQGTPKSNTTIAGSGGQAPPFRPNFTYDDPSFWAGAPVKAWQVAFLTQQKFYGQGGQVPSFRPNFTYDDASFWKWQYIYNPNIKTPSAPTLPFRNYKTYWYDEPSFWQGAPVDAAPIALLTHQKVYGVGGQVPPFRPNFTYDDPAFWQGEPINSAAIQLLTAFKFYGQGGQVPPFRPNFTYDDASFWQWKGYPTSAAPIALLTHQNVYGVGGQVPPFYPNFTFDDQDFWKWQHNYNPNLITSTAPTKSFTNRQIYWYDEPSFWQGSPTAAAPISLLTFIKFYGQGGQTPPFKPNFTYDDANVWQWKYPTNPNIFVFHAPSPSFTNHQIYWYAEPSFWSGQPESSATISLLTSAKFFGSPGQAPTKTWRYDADHGESFWSVSPRSITIQLLTAVRFFGQAGQVPPFHPNFTYDDPAFWQGEPVNSAAIQLLTSFKFYGQGGQASPFRWNATLDDPPSWLQPFQRSLSLDTSKFVEPFALRQPTFYSEDLRGRGIQHDQQLSSFSPLSSFSVSAVKLQTHPWNFGWDDPPPWRLAPRNEMLYITKSLYNVSNQKIQLFDYDSSEPWSRTITRNYQLNPPVIFKSFNNRKTFWYFEDSDWTGKPYPSAIIPFLTKIKFFGQGGQAPIHPPRFDYDVAETFWQYRFILNELPLVTKIPIPPPRPFLWNYNYDDWALWPTGWPLRRSLFVQPAITAMVKVTSYGVWSDVDSMSVEISVEKQPDD